MPLDREALMSKIKDIVYKFFLEEIKLPIGDLDEQVEEEIQDCMDDTNYSYYLTSHDVKY